ncbi:MAG TPA: YfdX family protein [Terriglobia bacterium]|nr:YfdX family protein [Terriglobia bacterium]
MKRTTVVLAYQTSLLLALSLGLAGCRGSQEAKGSVTETPAPTQAHAQVDVTKQQKEAEQQARPDIEKQRSEAEQQAGKTLDQEAISAIGETQDAVKAIAGNRMTEAVSAIERATGKINILLARNKAAALIPVSAEVDIIDLAPEDTKTIAMIARTAETTVIARDFPTARVLLDGLTSEIRTRTFNLPLATYPDALKDAAVMLDQKKNKEAVTTLLTALHTLVVVDRTDPLPLMLAKTAIDDAQEQSKKDKAAALKTLQMAQHEVERAKELGYGGKDPEYVAINKSITDLSGQLKGSGDTLAAFSALKDKLASLFKRQSDSARHS